jgi:thiol-disulfide isomerase/thioredoxin
LLSTTRAVIPAFVLTFGRMPISRRTALAAAGYCLGVSQWGCSLFTSDTPHYSVTTIDGEKYDYESLLGKVVLLQFWATWCPHCRSDSGAVDNVLLEFGREGLVVLAIDVGESEKKVRSFLAEHDRRPKIALLEDTNLRSVFGSGGIPYYVLINREGRIVADQRGAGGEELLRGMLKKTGLETLTG